MAKSRMVLLVGLLMIAGVPLAHAEGFEHWRIHWNCHGAKGCIATMGSDVGADGDFASRQDCESYLRSPGAGLPVSSYCSQEAASTGTFNPNQVPSTARALAVAGGLSLTSWLATAAIPPNESTGLRPAVSLPSLTVATVTTLALATNAKDMSPIGVGVLAGVGTAAAVTAVEARQHETGTRKDLADTPRDAAVAGAITGAVAASLKYVAQKVSPKLAPFSGARGRLTVSVGPKGIVGWIRW